MSKFWKDETYPGLIIPPGHAPNTDREKVLIKLAYEAGARYERAKTRSAFRSLGLSTEDEK